MRVRLSGGTNDGRVLELKHGSSVSVVKLASMSNDPAASVPEVAELAERETYSRPRQPEMIDGAEIWTVDL